MSPLSKVLIVSIIVLQKRFPFITVATRSWSHHRPWLDTVTMELRRRRRIHQGGDTPSAQTKPQNNPSSLPPSCQVSWFFFNVKTVGLACTYSEQTGRRNEMFYLMTHSTHFNIVIGKEMFYLTTHSTHFIYIKDHSDSKRGNLLPPRGLLFSIDSKGSFICTIPQTG